jgi:signal transduction histidine kinase
VIRSLRWRFFVVVWVLLVAGLVGLGTLLGRWGTVEINRVTSEARMEREIGDVSRGLASAALLASEADSAKLVAALREEMTTDSLIEGVVVSDGAGNIVVSTMPSFPPGELVIAPDGEFELRRDEVQDGRRAMVRVVGQGQLVDPRDSLDPRYLIVIPRVRSHIDALIQSDQRVIPSEGRAAAGVEGSLDATRSTILTQRIKLALVVGSILAALVTLAISGPLLGRVGELSRATDRLRHGDLGARVDTRGSDELGRLGASFNAMAARLESSEAQRKQMVTDVAHELRTPLTNLTGLIESVQDGLRNADRETLAALREETAMLEGLVDDLRDLALADAGELTVAREELDVAASVRRAVAGFDPAHEIIVDVASEPMLATADARRLGQVLRNLIQNAVTHSPEPGSVRLTVQGDMRPATGDPSQVARRPSPVAITIEDHGPGIAADQLERIWERFYRVDASRSRATGGMGLGLPVARRLVEAMGGRIVVESEVGRGSRFVVTLSS